MQNKPNFRNEKMNINLDMASNYKEFAPLAGPKNKPNSKPIKPKTNPIQTQLKPIYRKAKNEHLLNKVLAKNSRKKGNNGLYCLKRAGKHEKAV